MPFPEAAAITAFPKLVPIDMKSTSGTGSFAVYTLVPIPDMPSFLAKVNKDDILESQEDNVVLPPRYDFSGGTLADIMEYHIALTSSPENIAADLDGIDYGNYLVAIHEDCATHGVLVVDIVYEYYSDIEAVPNLARAPVDHGNDHENIVSAVAWCVNLSIANMDFYDCLEQDEHYNWPSPLPGHDELRKQLTQSCINIKQRARDRFAQLPLRTERYSVHHLGDRIRQNGTHKCDIENDIFYKELCEMNDRIATTHPTDLGPMTSEPMEKLWEDMRREHPGNCAERHAGRGGEWSWGVNRFWMFVYDTEAEVALVKVKWDGVTKDKSFEELWNIMPECEIVERCRSEEALKKMDRLAGIS